LKESLYKLNKAGALITAGEYCSREVVASEPEMTVNEAGVLIKQNVVHLGNGLIYKFYPCQPFTVIFNWMTYILNA
jgi:hypothetical protein